jgi:hypothetical protein
MQTTLGLASSSINPGKVQPELSYLPEPAVHSGFTYEVSTAYYERPIALSFVLTTDGNAASRQIGLELLTPTGLVLAAVPVASPQAASLTYTYSFLAQLSNGNSVEAGVVTSPLFDFVVPSNYVLSVSLTNHQTGDQITNVCYYRDRYSTGPDGYPMGGFNLPGLAAFETATLDQG